ncbi:hypothetical protein KP509_21G013300 [Ceratopteris richardii]|uniref:Uncharacterized protein n=1 Tax=Ceratopteris richardii TaxID=49495 RepID=A0A8T2S7V0_CERRI|nr:hypothetical protein KP509_21G013300 [Ceratopteris richardii]
MQLFGSMGALIGVSRITAAGAVIEGSLAVAIEGVAAAFLARLVLVDVKELLLEDGAADGWIAAIALEYRGTMPRNAGGVARVDGTICVAGKSVSAVVLTNAAAAESSSIAIVAV